MFPKKITLNNIQFSKFALVKLLTEYTFDNILDIGSGSGEHSLVFKKFKKKVTAIDFGKSIYFNRHSSSIEFMEGNYLDINFSKKFDAIWASHVLEHQPNPHNFLKKISNDCKENGVICITVPPLKHEIVGGHVTLWNGGLLLYHLVLAGINCKDAKILQYGYNISIITQNISISQLPELSYDNGDISLLSPFFPSGLSEPFDGNIKRLNW